ncbi:hypothetical protein GCM10012275_04630 [Longimycelium tulufanense]|uniref:Uncharacterized protein n=1 Tax=Longimycelium tulufanense TaxID=907463 RepID=A0A8J3FUM6_9PSEU|nr:hypothetical protein GCM10012275_04630 [Longimycelium tulufanense]
MSGARQGPSDPLVARVPGSGWSDPGTPVRRTGVTTGWTGRKRSGMDPGRGLPCRGRQNAQTRGAGGPAPDGAAE